MQSPREELETEIKLTLSDDSAGEAATVSGPVTTLPPHESQVPGIYPEPASARQNYRNLLGSSCIFLLVVTLCCICIFGEPAKSTAHCAHFLQLLLIVLIPIVIAIPSTISAFRQTGNTVRILNLSTWAWTVVPWVMALMTALRSSFDESASSRNLWWGKRIAVVSSLAGLAGWAITAYTTGFNEIAACICATAFATQLALGLHWSGTIGGIHQRIWSEHGSRSPVKGWEAFIASFMTAGLLPVSAVLSGAAALNGHFISYAKTVFAPSLELALCTAGEVMFVWCVIVFWALFTAVVNYRLTKALDEASMGHAKPQERSFQLTRRLLPGVGFASLCFYAPFAAGGSESAGCIAFWQGIAFFIAYALTRELLKERLPKSSEAKIQSALEKLFDRRA